MIIVFVSDHNESHLSVTMYNDMTLYPGYTTRFCTEHNDATSHDA